MRVEDENCNITPFIQLNSRFNKQTSFRPKTRGWKKRVHHKWKTTGMGKDAQKDSHHEVSWCRTNSTVLMGTISAVMFPVVTEIALESKTLLSRVTRGKDMAVGAAVFLTVLSIVTIAKKHWRQVVFAVAGEIQICSG